MFVNFRLGRNSKSFKFSKSVVWNIRKNKNLKIQRLYIRDNENRIIEQIDRYSRVFPLVQIQA